MLDGGQPVLSPTPTQVDPRGVVLWALVDAAALIALVLQAGTRVRLPSPADICRMVAGLG